MSKSELTALVEARYLEAYGYIPGPLVINFGVWVLEQGCMLITVSQPKYTTWSKKKGALNT